MPRTVPASSETWLPVSPGCVSMSSFLAHREEYPGHEAILCPWQERVYEVYVFIYIYVLNLGHMQCGLQVS